ANPLILQNASSQIVDDAVDQFSRGLISWSPDGKDLIATISSELDPLIATSYLLDTDRENNQPNNVTNTLSSVNTTWTRLQTAKDKATTNSLPKPVRKIVADNFKVLAYS